MGWERYGVTGVVPAEAGHADATVMQGDRKNTTVHPNIAMWHYRVALGSTGVTHTCCIRFVLGMHEQGAPG